MTGTERDPLYNQAVRIIRNAKRPRVTMLQRELVISYSRAVRIIGQMQAAGITEASGLPIPKQMDCGPGAEVEQ